ncbi:MAG: translation initiation factor IF-3 [Gaiellaceae bacterium]
MRSRRPVEPVRPRIDQPRINEAIRVKEVRLIGEEGEQIGIKSRQDALDYAFDKNLDLVEVAGEADPPVCRVMDYGKYRYEQEQKAKIARKHQLTIQVKEIKLRPKISSNDYNTKKGHVVRFLKDRAKVKVTIMFRGREQTHPERGRQLLMQLAEDVADLGLIESAPLQDGRNMTMVLAPLRNVAAPDAASTDAAASSKSPAADAKPAAAAAKPAAAAAKPAAAAAEPAASEAVTDAPAETASDETADDKEAADA